MEDQDVSPALLLEAGCQLAVSVAMGAPFDLCAEQIPMVVIMRVQ